MRGEYHWDYFCPGCGETIYVFGGTYTPQTCVLCQIETRIKTGGALASGEEIKFSEDHHAVASAVFRDGKFLAIEMHPLDDEGRIETWDGRPIVRDGHHRLRSWVAKP